MYSKINCKYNLKQDSKNVLYLINRCNKDKIYLKLINSKGVDVKAIAKSMQETFNMDLEAEYICDIREFLKFKFKCTESI